MINNKKKQRVYITTVLYSVKIFRINSSLKVIKAFSSCYKRFYQKIYKFSTINHPMLTIFCSFTMVKALTLYYLNLNNRIFNYVVQSFTEKSILIVLIFILMKTFFSNIKNVNSNMKRSIKKPVIFILRVITRVKKILEKMELRELKSSIISIIGTFLNNTSILPPSFITKCITIKPFLLGYGQDVVIKTKRYFHTLNMESLNFNIS